MTSVRHSEKETIRIKELRGEGDRREMGEPVRKRLRESKK